MELFIAIGAFIAAVAVTWIITELLNSNHKSNRLQHQRAMRQLHDLTKER